MSRACRMAALSLAAALAACARPDPPLLTLSGRVCDVAPVLTNAAPVPFDSRAGVSVTLGANTPCLDTGGGRSVTYAVFRLPDATGPYQLTITSAVVGNAVVAPRATVYDAAGAVLRTLPPSEFRQGIAGFTAGLRSQGSERLLLVSADPATIGQPTTLRLSAREIGTQLAAAAVIPIIIAVPVYDQTRERGVTLSLNGVVSVSAVPIATIR